MGDIKCGVRVGKRTGTRVTPVVEFRVKENKWDEKGRGKQQDGGVTEGQG